MGQARELINVLKSCGAGLFTGVPDSLLSQLSAGIMAEDCEHIIAANEGNAVGLALGDYLATQRPAVVYTQNSGLGNVVNPITSLADAEVYSVPMFLVIGWRGEPGVKDEPQHVKQGEITPGMLNTLGIPYLILSEESAVAPTVQTLWRKMLRLSAPVALLVRKGAIKGEYPVHKKCASSSLTREEAIKAVLAGMPDESFFVATTGKAGRELYEIRERQGQEERDFLTVGGMGHASSIALAVARHQERRWTVCLDGDGAAIMHLGAMATIGAVGPKRFLHVILNNYAHESVGGQPTVADGVAFDLVSQGLGYDDYAKVQSVDEIVGMLKDWKGRSGCFLLEILVKQGARSDLGRPKKTPQENKTAVMSFLSDAQP